MTMENSGHEETKQAAANIQPPAHADLPNPSRRRFTRIGAGASAVVMTLASRSVLANMACTTASGFTSVNQSVRRTDTPINCSGLPYTDWMATTTAWPIARESSFATAFANSPKADLVTGEISSSSGLTNRDSVALAEATLQQALFGTKTPEVVKYLIAALLNAHSNRSTYPSVLNVQTIFKEWNSNDTYEVMAGVKWNADQIIEYLRATQTPGTRTTA
ncbi:MAG: hypothetical protein JWM30_3016 [Burkholderia sp.]|nr:hypothetical protein [Burkholderia sp.]